MQGLPFKRALDERSGKTFADSHGLGVVEVASTAWPIFHQGKDSLTLFGVRSSKLRQTQVTNIEETAQDNKRAHLELSSKSLQVIREVIPAKLHTLVARG